MKFDSFDTIVLLGSRVTDSTPEAPLLRPVDRIAPFVHTLMRYRATQLLYGWRVGRRVLIIGGHALGVHYDLDPHAPLYKHPDFSFESVRKAQEFISEARALQETFVENGMPKEAIAIEETALAIEEAVAILRILCKRRQTHRGAEEYGVFLSTTPPPRLAVLTNYYAHKKTRDAVAHVGLKSVVEVLCAEDVLAHFAPLHEHWISKITDFYRELGMSDKGRNNLRCRLREIQENSDKN